MKAPDRLQVVTLTLPWKIRWQVAVQLLWKTKFEIILKRQAFGATVEGVRVA